MWITNHLAARVLVWLTATTVPIQGLPSGECHCSKTSTAVDKAPSEGCCCCARSQPGPCPCTGAAVCHCGDSSPCHKRSHSCCAAENAATSPCRCCCSSTDKGGTCPCGANCQCGKNNHPNTPATPPVEHNSPERIVADSALAISCVSVQPPCASRQHLDFWTEINSSAAIDRCVILCRFTV